MMLVRILNRRASGFPLRFRDYPVHLTYMYSHRTRRSTYGQKFVGILAPASSKCEFNLKVKKVYCVKHSDS